MYLLGKHLGLERVYALFAGLVYCFSGFMVGHLIHQGFIYQAAWFPLVFLWFRRGILERSPRAMIVSGLLLGHAILAGAPQITLYIVLFLFCYFLFELFRIPGTSKAAGAFRMSLLAAGPIAIALLVTAVQLLPTRELAPLSQRAEITYEKASEGSLAYEQIITLALPKYFGSSGARGVSFQMPGLPYWQYWETTGYIGIGALAFACVGWYAGRGDRFVAFLGVMVVFGLLFALGSNFIIHRLFHDYVPGFDTFRVPGRMILYFDFAGSILAAFGLRHVTGLVAGRSPAARKLAIGLAVAAVLLFLAGQAGFLVSPAPGDAGMVARATAASEGAKGAAFLALTALVVFLSGRGTFGPVAFLAVIFVVQFADAHVYGFNQNNGTTDPDAYYARTAATASFLKEEGKKEIFRVNSRDHGAMILDRNEGMLDRIFLMEGYTPLGLARFFPPMNTWSRICDLMNAKYRIAVDQEKRSMSLQEATGYAPRAFMVYRSYVASSTEDAESHIASETFDPMREAVFEEAPPGPAPEPPAAAGAPEPSWEAAITSYDLNVIRLRVSTGAAGYLILSEVWYPGWRASVDGADAPVLKADWCLRAVPLAAGTHEVTVEFTPSSFRTGSWISGISLVLALAGFAVAKPPKGSA